MRSIAFLILLFLGVLCCCAPSLVSAQDPNGDELRCFNIGDCVTCANTPGCGFCGVALDAGSCIPSGSATTTCPRISNLRFISGNGEGCSLLTNNPPPTGGFDNSDLPLLIPAAGFAGSSVSMKHHRVIAAIVLMCIITLAGILALVATPLFGQLMHRSLGRRSQSEPEHFLLSTMGRVLLAGGLLVVWVLLLAGLASNAWTKYDYGFGRVYGGVASYSTETGNRGTTTDYSCDGLIEGSLQQCRTMRAGAILTLLFGIVAIVACTLALGYLVYLIVSKQVQESTFFRVVQLGLATFFAAMTATLMWALGAHLAATATGENDTVSGVDLSVSWGLFFTAWILSAPVVFLLAFTFTRMDYKHDAMQRQEAGATMASGHVNNTNRIDNNVHTTNNAGVMV